MIWDVRGYAIREGQRPAYNLAVGDDEYMGYVPTTVKYIVKPQKVIKIDTSKNIDNINFYGDSLAGE